MRTATVRELRNHYRALLESVEAGEEVNISRRGKVVARLVPANKPMAAVDWTQSAAARLDRTGFRVLSAKESSELLAESSGRY